MDFVGNSRKQVSEILAALGISSIEELFSPIPSDLQVSPLNHDDGLSELEVKRLMHSYAKNNQASHMLSFLGGGAYEHFIPALASAVCQKSGFLTCYTPYQAEVSQGTLQVTYEFQSAVCALTGMDVANAGVYDGACAVAEAALMALRAKKGRNKLLVAQGLHPHYRQTLEQYLSHYDVELVTLPWNQEFLADKETLAALLDERVAALIVQSPNTLGLLESAKELFAQAASVGALSILAANPLAYGLFASAKEQGADIAVGEMQPLGIPLQFGGPYLGYMAVQQPLVRQLPGRIVGKTQDLEGKEGYVLTLQTREQHIRREKATSNICTSQALMALSSLVTILWYGKEGLRELAMQNFQKAHYLQERLIAQGFEPISQAPFFNEFTLKAPHSIASQKQEACKEGLELGLDLSRFYPQLTNHWLVAVTETKSKQDLDRYVEWVEQRSEVHGCL